tara:strand:- start:78 stop:500 length:423 start_codon:yes stop_codon:yes gene_type:complete
MDDSDIYWDLHDLNQDALIEVDYTEAYLGFALNSSGKWVAVYDHKIIEDIEFQNLVQDESFIDQTLQKLDGEVKQSDVHKAVMKLAKIEAIKSASDFVQTWVGNDNAPLSVHYPKVLEAQLEEQQKMLQEQEDEPYKYDG